MTRSSAPRAPFHERYFHYLILIPALLIMIALTVYPVINVVQLSFYRYSYARGEKAFIGLENYYRLASDRFFVKGLSNTFQFMALATVAELALGLGLALLFNTKFRGRQWLLALLIFPMMLSTMVVCAVWGAMYHYDFGIINHVLRAVGLSPVRWLFDPNLALKSIVLIDLWQWTPMVFLILLAGLQSIPAEIYEAGRVDGASGFRLFRHMTLPLIKRHFLLAALLRIIDTFKIFDKVYALTGGGPGDATETISLHIYREGFRYFNLGRAAAAAVVMLIAVTLISAVYVRQVIREHA
ncbi:MAG: sugar ABC transporter permease [Candidatus Acetothermia bacterium]|nr:sugar ABC transporter permease [Candidatus Acetothermia bacterium]